MPNTIVGACVVIAHKWGLLDNHSYLVGVFAGEEGKESAIQVAKEEFENRGGKYGIEVRITLSHMRESKQIFYIESRYFGNGEGIMPADGKKSFLDTEFKRHNKEENEVVQWAEKLKPSG